MQNGLHLLDASVRHLGTDKNYVVLENLYAELKDKVDFYFDTPVDSVLQNGDGYIIKTAKGDYECDKCIISAGRSGSKWMEKVCSELNIPTKSNRVDIGVRVELPAEVFSHLTDELYESKIVYRTAKFEDLVRTFCMNPHGVVVNENTNGIVTVNGHSNSENGKKSDNTNFALLVSQHFTQPFNNSNEYGESIVRLSNMLGGEIEGFLNKPMCKQLEGHDDQLKQVVNTIESIYCAIINDHLPKILESIDISKIVRERINEMDVNETEKLIFQVMDKELKAIVWLGALLGLVMGSINILL